MKKKKDIDFEVFLDNALRSYGYLFPVKDKQMDVYEKNVELKELPSELRTPSFVFNSKTSTASTRRCTDVERAIVAGHIINKCNEDFGRVKFQKLLYLVEHVFQLDFDSNYERKAAGPYDRSLLRRVESTLQQYNFFKIPQNTKITSEFTIYLYLRQQICAISSAHALLKKKILLIIF